MTSVRWWLQRALNGQPIATATQWVGHRREASQMKINRTIMPNSVYYFSKYGHSASLNRHDRATRSGSSIATLRAAQTEPRGRRCQPPMWTIASMLGGYCSHPSCCHAR
jgi:hypothetical protein